MKHISADYACTQGEHNPLPLMSKGESDLVLLPSSPKGEIVGIMFLVWLYVTDVVLDGNTHGMALNMMRIKKYAGEKFTEFYAEISL